MLTFIGIGAQKAGTSWLHSQLAAHPEIGFPGGKEVHFWDKARGRGISGYRQLFDGPGTEGDITPAYGILEVETITRIRAEFPELRIIYFIRNPIDRAWSAALMALGRAEMTIDEASDQWFIDHFRSAGSLARGNYEQCLRNWRAVFPPRQIMIGTFEDIERAPRQLLQRVATHIGVEAGYYDAVADASLGAKVFEGPSIPIRPPLRQVLRDIYDPQITSLSSYLEIDLSPWRSG